VEGDDVDVDVDVESKVGLVSSRGRVFKVDVKKLKDNLKWVES
jgi:hypothetical protein